MSYLMRRLAICGLIASLLIIGVATRPGAPAATANGGSTAFGQNLAPESEPNDAPTQANPLASTDTVVVGNIYRGGDVDIYSFSASAGSRLFAATMTGSSASTGNTVLTLLAGDGTTVIESDDNDGAISASASSIAGATLSAGGTYYLKVAGNIGSTQVLPYHLHVRVQAGSPTAEVEPNGSPAQAQTLPASGYIAGTSGFSDDQDYYTLTLQLGDTLFVSLDLNPERDGTTWDGRIGVGDFNGLTLLLDGSGATSPNSEAYFVTVKQAGTYYVYVDSAVGNVGNPAFTYLLSVSVHPARQASGCTTYASSDVPKTIGPNAGVTTSSITIPDDTRIGDIQVSLQLNHQQMADIDATLTAPGGNTVGLFADIGSASPNAMGETSMDVTLNDDAAFPIGIFRVLNGMVVQPQAKFRLGWFKGQSAAGTWTLNLHDDADGNGGTLTGWSITICAEPAPPTCAPGFSPVTLYGSDFEATDGGFTHTGQPDQWAWGAPSAAPITTAASGSKVWKTNLSGDLQSDASMDLRSPQVNLSGVVGPITVRWAQKYQMETAASDHLVVSLTAGATTQTLFEHIGPTMETTVGSANTTLEEAAGWSVQTRDISAFVNTSVQLRFHVDTDPGTNLAGLAIDDVSITGCSNAIVATATATATATPTSTGQATATSTATPTATGNATATSTSTATPTATGEATATATATATPTATGNATATSTSTATATATSNGAQSPTPTTTPTITPTVGGTSPGSKLFLPLVSKGS